MSKLQHSDDSSQSHLLENSCFNECPGSASYAEGFSRKRSSQYHSVGLVSLSVVLVITVILTGLLFNPSAAHAQSKAQQQMQKVFSSCSQASSSWSTATDVYWRLNTCDTNAIEQTLNNAGWWGLGAGSYYSNDLKWALFLFSPFAWTVSYTLWSTDQQCGWNGVIIDESFLYSTGSGLPSIYIQPVC